MKNKIIKIKIEKAQDKKKLYYDNKKMGNLLIIGGSNDYRNNIVKEIIVFLVKF